MGKRQDLSQVTRQKVVNTGWETKELEEEDRKSLHATSALALVAMLSDYMSDNSSDLKDLYQVVWKYTLYRS